MHKPTHGKYERRSRLSVPLLLLCLLFAGIFLFSGYKVITIWLEYRKGEQTYTQLQQYIQLPTQAVIQPTEDVPASNIGSSSKPADSTAITPETVPFVSPVDFDALWNINPDVVGWINIPGTNVNYPIVQGESNSTYLYHLITGEYNHSGSIFMDYRNTPDYTDQNTVIYGHHMGDGSMFADVVKYKRQSYYDEHPIGYLFTPEKTYTLTFFTAYVTDIEDDAWQMTFSSNEEYAEWLQDSAARSKLHAGILPSLNDRLLTFSTCTYEYDDARFVLVAIMR